MANQIEFFAYLIATSDLGATKNVLKSRYRRSADGDEVMNYPEEVAWKRTKISRGIGDTADSIRGWIENFNARLVSAGSNLRYQFGEPDSNFIIPPSSKMLDKWTNDSVCRSVDNCKVEPDGKCPHGYESWLVFLGMV